MTSSLKFAGLLVALAVLLVGCRGGEEPQPPERTIVYRTAPTASVAGEIAVEPGVTAFGILVYAEGTSFVEIGRAHV